MNNIIQNGYEARLCDAPNTVSLAFSTFMPLLVSSIASYLPQQIIVDRIVSLSNIHDKVRMTQSSSIIN